MTNGFGSVLDDVGTTFPSKMRMEMTEEDQTIARWLAAHTEADVIQVETELAEGELRREFVVDELLAAGYEGSELLDFTARLTGLTSAVAKALIVARQGLAAAADESPESKRDSALAENEILFRDVNERLASEEQATSPVELLELICECTDRACLKVFTMPLAEYEWLRQNPHRFVVLPGHEAPAVEDVVERHPGFVVVEKHAETHEQVEASDPRA
jgi:hypothetical protein